MAPDDGACMKLHSRLQKFQSKTRLPKRIEGKLAAWIFHNVDPFPSDPGASNKPMSRYDPDTHADAVIREIESRCETMDADASLFPAVAFVFAVEAGRRGKEQREAGRMTDARRTTACLSAFAKKLARRDRDEPEFHIVMSLAFAQEAKDGWHVNDYVVIEAAWRRALGEAGIALLLDPRNVDARVRLANLQEKLINLASRQSVNGR